MTHRTKHVARLARVSSTLTMLGAVAMLAAACNGGKTGETAGPPHATVGEPSNPPGTPSFTAADWYQVPPGPTNLVVDDFNGDGNLDLATASEVVPIATVLLGNGDGTFDELPQIRIGLDTTWMIAADLDGDGQVDLATANGDGTARVLWGKGEGTFSQAVSYEVQGDVPDGSAWSLAATDLNNDGALDLVVPVSPFMAQGQGHVAVLLNTGARDFADLAFYEDPTATGVVAGDFEGDGNLDVASANFDGTVHVFQGDGKGRLEPSGEYPIDGAGVTIEVGDFDGDGTPDLATGNDRSFSVSVLPGLGKGTFGSSVRFDAGNTHAVAPVDLDGDSHLDLIAGGYDEQFVRLWRGRGDGTFFPEARIDTGLGAGAWGGRPRPRR